MAYFLRPSEDAAWDFLIFFFFFYNDFYIFTILIFYNSFGVL